MPRARHYSPQSNDPFPLSRTGLEQFLRCPRCFYQQRRLGLTQPRMVPLTLAVATDALLKNEFDKIRGSNNSHPIWEKFSLNTSHPALKSSSIIFGSDGTDKVQVGLGYSFNVWNSLYFEPSYTMPVKEDDVTGDREGSFNFGLGWRF